VSLLARGPRTYYIREENLERTTVSTASTRPANVVCALSS
jgi:hypothetical protein